MSRLAVVLILLLAVPGTAGCFGGGGHQKRAGGEPEEKEREKATRGVPAPDRVAFYQLATSSGIVRADALAHGPATRARLNDAIPRLARLRPRDPLLKRLRTDLVGAASGLRERRRGARQRAVGVCDRVARGLRRYTNKHPGAGAVVPD
jgi:hypothetical protein